VQSSIGSLPICNARPVDYGIALYFPISRIPLPTVSQELRDNRQVQPVLRHLAPRCPARKGFSHRNKAPFFFISHSETNCGVIVDITHSDLAIVSRQVL